jgi:putative Holliday junction resolvase
MQKNNQTRQLPTRLIGVDFGLARLGIALSDEGKKIAFPLKTLKSGKTGEQTITAFLKELEESQSKQGYQVSEIVVGLPLLMSGKTGFLADEVKHFVEELKKHTMVPIVLWDERLTSVQAERSLRESSLTRKRRSSLVDTVAAVIILQNYLDSKIREFM